MPQSGKKGAARNGGRREGAGGEMEANKRPGSGKKKERPERKGTLILEGPVQVCCWIEAVDVDV